MESLGGSAAQSNLQSFLNSTTPIVPSQQLPKACFGDQNRLWHPLGSDTVEFFTLKDLWSCYEEWSAYGAGAPIVSKDGKTIVQYYVPYLSAIQIYTGIAPSSNSNKYLKEETEMSDLEMRESSDSCSYDSESEKLWRSDIGSSEDCGSDLDGTWHLNDRLGHLSFQYIDSSPPHERPPLMYKINELAEEFPGLVTLTSVDLSPASWMAVAWYPIYHMPKCKSVKGLSTCFLTYHTLSSSFQDNSASEIEPLKELECIGESFKTNGLVLNTFGLVTRKLHGFLWASEDRERNRLLSMLSSADSWLKQLRVRHHDFNYFIGIPRR